MAAKAASCSDFPSQSTLQSLTCGVSAAFNIRITFFCIFSPSLTNCEYPFPAREIPSTRRCETLCPTPSEKKRTDPSAAAVLIYENNCSECQISPSVKTNTSVCRSSRRCFTVFLMGSSISVPPKSAAILSTWRFAAVSVSAVYSCDVFQRNEERLPNEQILK